MSFEFCLPSGRLSIIGLGRFATLHIGKVQHPTIYTRFDDPIEMDFVSVGDVSSEGLTFKKSRKTFSPIYSSEVFPQEHERFKRLALEHFVVKEFKNLLDIIPAALEVDRELSIDDVYAADIKFAEQFGSDGHFVLVDKNTAVIVDQDDFKLHLVDVDKRGHKTAHGFLLCERPVRVIKLRFKSLSLSSMNMEDK